MTNSESLDYEPLLLLASQSEGRRETLRRAGISFTAQPADVDEDALLASAVAANPDMSLADRVLVLARAKAEATCAASDGGYVVLGCDSMLEVDGELVGKPLEPSRAVERWRDLRGKSAVLHSGHWMVDDRDPEDGGTGATFGQSTATVIHVANLSDEEIEAYVGTGEPLGVAGGFTIDGRGGPFIERIEGDHHTVVGLSLPLLRTLLQEINLPITDLWEISTPQ